MPSFSEIFASDDASTAKGSNADPFTPSPGEGDTGDGNDKPEGGDGGPTIASDSSFAQDDFAA